jgi:hypothetical protein
MILKLRKTEMTASSLSVTGVNNAPENQGLLENYPLEDGMNYMLLDTKSSIVFPNFDKTASLEN